MHLRLRVHQQPALVLIRVRAWVGIGFGARAGARPGAGGLEGGTRAVSRPESAEPAGAHADVVEIGGAIGVGL